MRRRSSSSSDPSSGPAPPLRHAIYARVSTADQEARGTILMQLDFAEKFCALHGLSAERYVDEDVSGTLPMAERPAGARLMADARSGLIDVVLIYRVDRLARDTRVLLNTLHELDQAGVTVRGMHEEFDSASPTGRLLLQILAAISENERLVILDRLWSGANRAAREGRWLGGIVPFGYRVDPESKRLTVCEAPLPGCGLSEAEVVRLIFRLSVEEHATTERIADYLNARGVPPAYVRDGREVTRGKRKQATAGHWTPGRVYNMLRSQTYKGVHVYGKRATRERDVIERAVPAIVDAATWDRAQAVLAENALEAVRNQRRQYLLRGLIRCECGRAFHGTAFPSGKKGVRAYYVCGGKNDNYAPPGEPRRRCESKNLPAADLEDRVWADCCEFIRNPGRLLEEVSSLQLSDGQRVEVLHREGAEVEGCLGRLAADREAMLDLYRRGLIGLPDLERQLEKSRADEAALRARARAIAAGVSEREAVLAQAAGAAEMLERLQANLDGLSFEERRRVVLLLVEEIRVTTEGEGRGRWAPKVANVEVVYRFNKAECRTDVRAKSSLDIIRALTVKGEAKAPRRRRRPPASSA